ncbi:hypothetical protein R3P38DRAFT_3514134 [Favolaschia claudopus]|uniref:Uncharacterized protein n=1 Tax=Favolaschia claudopus TaxID=2862362 RepID=A0AAW0BTG5_9AGAR
MFSSVLQSVCAFAAEGIDFGCVQSQIKTCTNFHRGSRFDIRTNPPRRDLECHNRFGVETAGRAKCRESGFVGEEQDSSRILDSTSFRKIIIAVSSNCEAASLGGCPQKCDEIKSASACYAEFGRSESIGAEIETPDLPFENVDRIVQSKSGANYNLLSAPSPLVLRWHPRTYNNDIRRMSVCDGERGFQNTGVSSKPSRHSLQRRSKLPSVTPRHSLSSLGQASRRFSQRRYNSSHKSAAIVSREDHKMLKPWIRSHSIQLRHRQDGNTAPEGWIGTSASYGKLHAKSGAYASSDDDEIPGANRRYSSTWTIWLTAICIGGFCTNVEAVAGPDAHIVTFSSPQCTKSVQRMPVPLSAFPSYGNYVFQLRIGKLIARFLQRSSLGLPPQLPHHTLAGDESIFAALLKPITFRSWRVLQHTKDGKIGTENETTVQVTSRQLAMLQGSRFPEDNTASAAEFVTQKGNEGGTESKAIDPQWAEADGSTTLLDEEADEDHLATIRTPPSGGIPHRHVDTFEPPGHVADLSVKAIDQSNAPSVGDPRPTAQSEPEARYPPGTGFTTAPPVPAEGSRSFFTRVASRATEFVKDMDFRA